MASFKDYLIKDTNNIFNTNEFAGIHNIDGQEKTIIKDNELLKERQAKYAEGTYKGDLLFFIKKDDFGEAPAIGQPVKFDNEVMRVSDFNENEGVYEITLEVNLS